MKINLKIILICALFCMLFSACSNAADNAGADLKLTTAENNQIVSKAGRSAAKDTDENAEKAEENSVSEKNNYAGYISDADGNIIEYVPEITGEASEKNESSLTVSDTDAILESLIGTLSIAPPEEGCGAQIHALDNGLEATVSNIGNTVFAQEEENSEIYALEDGTVTEIGWEPALGYCISVENSEGRVIKYVHLGTDSAKVEKGNKVEKNQALACAGATGLTSKSGVGYFLQK